VECSESFVPLLSATFSTLTVWPRVLLDRETSVRCAPPHKYPIRRLGAADSYCLWGLSPEASWIWKTWGGPPGLASSGYAWGAFAADRLVAVACSYFVGERYEELGIATEPGFRGLGLAPACASALCEDIQSRGRQPSWTTSPDNHASIRAADKLGFVIRGHGRLYVLDRRIPEPPGRQAD
jgi:RimJ/RimL family protein N-acetyltransferase